MSRLLATIGSILLIAGALFSMKLLHQHGMVSGFWATEVDRVVPDIVDCSEVRHPYMGRVGPHLHRHWEFHYQVAGITDHYAVGGGKFVLKPGSFYSVGPHINHWHEHVSKELVHILSVGSDLAAVSARHPEWDVFAHLSPIFAIDNAHHLERSMARVLEEAIVALNHQSAALRLALDMLVLDVMRTLSYPVGARSSAAKHPAVLRAIHLLETRFREPWTLNEIAAHAGISRARLAELFRQDTGIPLHKFLTKVRVSQAEKLLRNSELPTESIALECGFATSQHFSRAFKLHTGLSPNRFRRKHR
jgi:AraC-like DNA-binding protein